MRCSCPRFLKTITRQWTCKILQADATNSWTIVNPPGDSGLIIRWQELRDILNTLSFHCRLWDKTAAKSNRARIALRAKNSPCHPQVFRAIIAWQHRERRIWQGRNVISTIFVKKKGIRLLKKNLIRLLLTRSFENGGDDGMGSHSLQPTGHNTTDLLPTHS